MYISQRPKWLHFTWQRERLEALLGAVRHQQGRVLGQMLALGFPAQSQVTLQNLTLDVLKSSEIEGEHRPADQVRSSFFLEVGGHCQMLSRQRHARHSGTAGAAYSG